MRDPVTELDDAAMDDLAGKLSHVEDDQVSDEPEATPDPEAELDDSTPEPDEGQAEDDDATPSEEDEEEGAESDEPALPDAYRRAAIHQGWKAEEIEELFKTNPELAERTFRNLYETTNELSRQFSQLGRAQKTQQDEPGQKKEQKKRFEYKRMDVEKLKKDFPDEPLVALIEQLDGGLDRMTEIANELAEERQAGRVDVEAARAQARGDRATEQIIDGFFRAKDLAVYKDFYGDAAKNGSWEDSLTGSQVKRRVEVLTLADQIIAGARVQGQDLDVETALERAHLLVAHDFNEQTIRERIKKDVSKRHKSMSIKPSSGKKKTAPDGSLSRRELVASVQKKLAALR